MFDRRGPATHSCPGPRRASAGRNRPGAGRVGHGRDLYRTGEGRPKPSRRRYSFLRRQAEPDEPRDPRRSAGGPGRCCLRRYASGARCATGSVRVPNLPVLRRVESGRSRKRPDSWNSQSLPLSRATSTVALPSPRQFVREPPPGRASICSRAMPGKRSRHGYNAVPSSSDQPPVLRIRSCSYWSPLPSCGPFHFR